MAAAIDCPVCLSWANVLDTRRVQPGVLRRRYECANGHRFITLSEEVVVSVLDASGKYVKVTKTEGLK